MESHIKAYQEQLAAKHLYEEIDLAYKSKEIAERQLAEQIRDKHRILNEYETQAKELRRQLAEANSILSAMDEFGWEAEKIQQFFKKYTGIEAERDALASQLVALREAVLKLSNPLENQGYLRQSDKDAIKELQSLLASEGAREVSDG